MENHNNKIHHHFMKDTSYKLMVNFDEFELRKYTPATVLEIVEIGSRTNALIKAKRKLLALIEQNKKILINESASNRNIPEILIEPLAKRNEWKFIFFLENNDLPLSVFQERITMSNQPEKHYGTVRVIGLMSNEKIVQKILLLKSWLAKEKLLIVGKPKIAMYKSYWNIAFLKRVEIYIEVEPSVKN